jgi:hypothetical protein
VSCCALRWESFDVSQLQHVSQDLIVTIQMLAVWLPTTYGCCSTLPAQGRRAPRKTGGLYAGSGRVPTECCQSGGH